MLKVLFVCLGNICRSPTAEGILTKLVSEKSLSNDILVDSCGISNYNLNQAPDLRSQKLALLHNVDISKLKARQINKTDFEIFDYILVMDTSNYQIVLKQCTDIYKPKIQKLLKYQPSSNLEDIPDPYYMDDKAFSKVYDLIASACSTLLLELTKKIETQRII